ncbi:MAG: hypothetical protein HQK61_05930 [Desulfamplus sp.]|nr:hypothetical protein [Desulfamplus sp.]
MTKKTALEKRIKRRITARTHRFFAVCSPGLKRLCYTEIVALAQKINPDSSSLLQDKKINPDNSSLLQDNESMIPSVLEGNESIIPSVSQGNESIIPSVSQGNESITVTSVSNTSVSSHGLSPLAFEDIAIIPGGVEFTGSVRDCYAANLYLGSPSRILMRIAKFRAENFRTLEKKLGEIEWELYLRPGISVKYEVSTASSRLYHSDAVAQRAQQVIEAYLQNQCGNCLDARKHAGGMQNIMIRGEDDLFEISIDSSGELLHKRGLKENVGAAPLRETIAFGILSAMGYSGDLPLIDGMCGSGSFALEAAMIACNIPPGFFRKFAFEQWPCFTIGTWNHMKKNARKNIVDQTSITSRSPVFAVDTDGTLLSFLQKTIDNYPLLSSIKTIKSDFFDLVPKEMIITGQGVSANSARGMGKAGMNNSDGRRKAGLNKGFVVLNPPYGKRIGNNSNIDQIYADIGNKLEADFRGWCAAVIVPDKRLLGHLPGNKSLVALFHGGLEIHAAIIQL